MTEQPPKNDEERPETPPSANASDSSTGLVDIHQLPHPKPENGEAPPAMPAHQPLAASEEPSANEVEPPSVDVQPEVPLAADTVANPFETINDHHHGDSPATDATAPTSAIGMGERPRFVRDSGIDSADDNRRSTHCLASVAVGPTTIRKLAQHVVVDMGEPGDADGDLSLVDPP
jgi:hypothetical protein